MTKLILLLSTTMLVATASIISGCDSPTKEEEAKKLEELKRQRTEREQKDKLEHDVMTNLDTATAEVGKRISNWITNVGDGIIVVDEYGGSPKTKTQDYLLYTIPASTPWLIACEKGSLEITLGGWVTTNSKSVESLITKFITDGAKTPTQCKDLSIIVARKMREIMSQ
jgi:DNA recombination-dependent growth factor C